MVSIQLVRGLVVCTVFLPFLEKATTTACVEARGKVIVVEE